MSSLRSGIKQVRVERPRPLKMGGGTQPELGQEDLVAVVESVRQSLGAPGGSAGAVLGQLQTLAGPRQEDIFVTEKSDLIKVMERSVKDVERLNVELTKLGDLRRQNEFTVTTLKEEFGKWKTRALKYERTLDKNRSMMELVNGARQVRRLIREVSLDSQDSDLDLELRETTGQEMETFHEDMSKLIENCGESLSDIGNNPGEKCNNTDESVSERSLPRDSSIPDFNLIEKKTCINRRLWKLTGFSEYESLNFSENSDHDNVSLVS